MTIESLRKIRTFLIVLVYLVTSMFGIRFALPLYMGLRGYLYNLVIGIIIAYICIIDSQISRKPLPTSTYWLILIFYPISIPICLIRSHRFKGILIFAIHLIGIVLIFSASFAVTNYIFDGY